LRNYQKELWQGIKSSSDISGVTVYGSPLTEESAYATLGDMSGYQDYGSMNNYFSGRHPGNNGWGSNNYGSLDWNVRVAKKASVSKPVVTTETGYHNLPYNYNSHKGVPEEIAAKYAPRLLLEQFNYGIARTFIYELINTYNNPNAIDQNLGLLRNDGSEKPAYGAIKNLLSLLKDPEGDFAPGVLNYALSGNTANIHHTLLQKKDGRFYLILWQEVSGFNVDSKEWIEVPSQKVTLTLNTWIAKATTYVPNDSSNFKSSQTYPKQIDIDVSDRPVVVELQS